ncbi:PIG-L deacetylase family protein [Deinococcus aquiradiocola]|uniref:PIG-L domain-containing protein n=1 Tax=Deinococcus aquiradiocola TaxID=393059 RepID=A0A917PLY9_9DEIO|nr:PIG-L deacetylase family protein [Deinococcus aquiradiocola]GGJ84135.1 PIG-L domain-containing protein [Deinococcus aquiradiocola]
MTTPRPRLLLIVPHPDDEVYGASGTLMEYVEAGDTVGLVTLTKGEAGRTLGLADGPEELGRIREVELRACLDVIGVQIHEHMSFPDKYLKDEPFGPLVQVALDAMRRHRPQTVLTFPPNGSNGHPDHVTTHRAVKAAWDLLPEAERPALWYYASPTPPENEALLAEYLPPNVTRDVTRYVTRKLTAIACHRTQALSTVDFMRKAADRITQETFHEVRPA